MNEVQFIIFSVKLRDMNVLPWRSLNTSLSITYLTAMLSRLDQCVGDVVSALGERGILNNSIIIFSTDNGGPAAGFNLNAASNWPLRGVRDFLQNIVADSFKRYRVIQNWFLLLKVSLRKLISRCKKNVKLRHNNLIERNSSLQILIRSIGKKFPVFNIRNLIGRASGTHP